MKVFGDHHTQRFWVPAVTLEEARKFNPSFGSKLAVFHGKPLPDEDAKLPSQIASYRTPLPHQLSGMN